MSGMEICVGILLVVAFLCGAAKGRPRLERDDLQRLKRLSDQIHREEILPFE